MTTAFKLTPSTASKRCPRCGTFKPLADFYKSRERGGGRAGWCKTCMAGYLNGDNGGKRKYRLKSQYGLTQARYSEMALAQGGLCAACGSPPTDRDRGAKLVVDHDHETGAVRGLLCNLCNRALGLLRDDPRVLDGLTAYLARWKERT